jgi:prepilin peptidase CpaA
MIEGFNLTYAVLLALPLLVFFAGAHDLLTYKIPNFISLALIGTFFIFAAIHPDFGWRLTGLHIACGIAVLIFGFALFACNLLGGGDGKLLAAIALWTGPQDTIEFIAVTGVAGGVVALWVISLRSAFWGYLFYHIPGVRNLFFAAEKKQNAFPYGVAIAFSLYAFLPQTEIFTMATKG